MSGPYFNTELYCRVALSPNQMDNDIYKHLKNNLIKKYQGKCYKSYGLIVKIHKINERSAGKLIAEDPSASAYYNVKFSCRLCKPLKNSIIVCEVVAISKSIIYLKNDKIDAFVLDSRNDVNPNNFIYDEKRNALIANIGNNQGIPVIEGVFLKVKVQGVRIEHGVNKIVVIGTLESMATQKESNESIIKRDDDDEDYKNYDEYNKQLENAEDVKEKLVEETSSSGLTSSSDEKSEEKVKKPRKK
jgi:DNA-directed RNA polymerase subunit E'/Rpb7